MVRAGQSDSFGVKNCAPPLGVTVMPALPATATAGSPAAENPPTAISPALSSPTLRMCRCIVTPLVQLRACWLTVDPTRHLRRIAITPRRGRRRAVGGEAATHGGGGTPVAGRREESTLALVRHDGTVANRWRWGYNTRSMSFLSELGRTFLPARASKHGPLPPLLVAMTFVTGLVDAFSYLLLGHVFVANMTGNVVLLGFALVGAPGFSVAASVVSMASFALGALVGGRVGARYATHRGHLLTTAATLYALLIAAVVLAAVASASRLLGRPGSVWLRVDS